MLMCADMAVHADSDWATVGDEATDERRANIVVSKVLGEALVSGPDGAGAEHCGGGVVRNGGSVG